MFELSAELSAQTALATQLQQLTERLAAAHTEQQVLGTALAPAMAALQALAGAVLLLDAQSGQLRMTAARGLHPQTIWQDGAVSSGTPASDALHSGHPLYFEHAGTLKAAYPELEAQTGGIVAVATAVLPLILDGQPLGVLILEFKEPHGFSVAERQFLATLAGQTALALSRARLIQAYDQQAAALQASETRFRHLIEISPVGMAVGSPDGRLSLVNDAYLRLLGYSRQEFETGQIDWQALTPVEYRAQDEQAFAAAFANGISSTYEKEMWTRSGERVPLGLTLLRAGEQEVAGYVQDLRAHRAQQQQLQEEGRRLMHQVTQGAAALEAEQDALRAFVGFTEAASQIGDLDQLATLGLDTLKALIPGATVVLTERTPECWVLKAWTDTLDPDLLAVAQQRGFPLDTPVFAGLLRTGEPSFTRGQPAVPGASRGGADRATAHYPVWQAGRIVAVIGLEVAQQEDWTETQQAIVRVVGRSFSWHYDRIALLEAARQRAESLDAFVTFTEASSRTNDVLALAAQAQDVLQTLLGVEVGYSLLQDGRWKGVLFSRTTPEEVRQESLAGFPADLPSFARPFQTLDAVFVSDWQADQEGAEHTELYGAVGLYPHVRHGRPYGLLTIAAGRGHRWTEREQRIFRSVGRSLGLVLERAEEARELQVEKARTDRHSLALNALMQLTQTLEEGMDTPTLIQRAQVLMLEVLPPGYATYFEAEHGRWRVRVQTGDAGNPGLQAVLDEGLVIGETPTFDGVAQSLQPSFLNLYDPAADVVPTLVDHIRAGTQLPLMVRGQLRGIFNFPLFEPHPWTDAERALLTTAAQHLGVAIERAERATDLQQMNQELQASNQELEAFTYSASHDLRTPVRHVKGFAELAARTVRHQQWDKLPRQLEIISEAADRMDAMIDAMLILSRVGRAELRVRPVPLTALVQRAQQDTELEYPQRPVQWQVSSLPTVQGDQQTLQQVLTNLLSNAVKYSSTRPQSVVRIWAEEHPHEVQVFVQDNGVGFDPQYVGKLFGAFQRLHTQQEFAGSGIGLATVRRIITRHGGRVWATAALGQGATFGFSLPRPRS